MKLKFLCVLCALCGSFINCLAIDREAFTFTKYDLNVQVEPAQQRLAVRGKITLRNDSSSPQKNLSLQISSSLDWRSIQVGGKPVQFVSQPYASDIDHTGALSEAIVTLPQEVPPKGTIELEIGYEGVIVLDATRLTRIGVPEERAKHSDWDQISKTYTAVRGIGYVAWYPVAMESTNLSDGNNVFDVVARWKAKEAQAEMNVRVADSGEGSVPTVLCNGESGQQMYEQVGRSYEVTMECSYRPLETTVPLFIIGDYEALDRSVLNISYLPEHKTGAENFALAAQLLTPLVTEWFATKKDKPELKAEVIELPDSEAASYESGRLLLSPLANVDSRLYELTAVHELTHAAFLSPRPWIYEGLAHFAQALDREQHSDRQGALDFMKPFHASIVDAEKSASVSHSQNAAERSLINTSAEDFYRSKAMFVWWMLREMIGDDALKKALTTYKPDQDKDPSYLQRLIEAQSKRDLQWFFDDWVYADRGLPDFHVESAYAHAGVGGGYFISVTVENLGNAGAEVPLTIKTQAGQVSKRLEVRAKSKASIRIDVPSKPEEIVINDGSVPESDMSNNTYKISLTAK